MVFPQDLNDLFAEKLDRNIPAHRRREPVHSIYLLKLKTVKYEGKKDKRPRRKRKEKDGIREKDRKERKKEHITLEREVY